MDYKILIAGFGGQGILFSGKVIANTGLMLNKEVSWLPSYGPEMRGGTANCSINVSDNQIGSPIVSAPNVLVAMNLPSLEKYENDVDKDGFIIYDSSLISKDVTRTDVNASKIPATRLASDNGLEGLANMVILGKVLKETKMFTLEEIVKSIEKVVPAKKQELLGKNVKAIEIGYNY
ncbi:MAG: 2-oxoacid:ferredoxin oxidoreductase subunit gamma [Clostridiales bacterium]|nr:2-oxoacid:ferredoxin oxidoreductase subunit gamma [Clostridiales bacterium]